MKALGLILAALLLFLLLLLLYPVRVRIRYEDGLRIAAGLGPVRIRLYPGRPGKKEPKGQTKKQKKPHREKPGKAKKPPRPKEKPSLSMILELIRLGLKAVGAMLRPLSVPRLHLAIRVGGKDAAGVALTYGELTAGISMLYPMAQKSLRIRDGDIAVDADFSAERIELRGDVILSACPLRYLIAACRVLVAYLRLRKQEEKRKQEMQKKGGNRNEQHQ